MSPEPPYRALIRRLLLLQPGERKPLMRTALYAFLVMASYAVLKPVRDEIGAEHRDVMERLWTGTFLVMVAVAPLYGWMAARWPRRKLVARVFVGFIAVLLGFWALLHLLPEESAARRRTDYSFYVWVSVFNLYVLSLFWAQAATAFRSEQGRRLFGLVALGLSLGMVVGPLLVRLTAEDLGATQMLLLSVGLLVLAMLFTPRPAPEPAGADPVTVTADEVPGGGVWDGALAVVRSPYLAGIAAYLLLSLVAPGFLYFLKAEIAGAAFADRAARLDFFSSVDLASNTLTFVLQLCVTGRVMRRFGTGPALLALPLLTALLFAALGTWPTLAMIVAIELTRRAANFALAKPAREVLFTVVGDRERYRAKPFLDTVVYRGGDVGVAWMHEGLSAVLSTGGVALAVVPFAMLWAGFALRLARFHRKNELHQPPPPVHPT